MKNGSMFKALHKYKNRTFFDEHSEIIIYQKGKILTYKIFAAYTSDAKHLLLSYNLEDENVFLNYLNNVLTNSNKSSNINITIPVSSEDRIITLSTCNNNDAQRYLVQAVLLSIQE
jgi:sortase B